MGGHVLWLPSDIFNPIQDLIKKIYSQDAISVDDVEETMGSIFTQAALSEQAHIIQQLLNSGMTKEEVAFRLNRDIFYINEISDLELNNDYDFSFIKGATPYSRKSK